MTSRPAAAERLRHARALAVALEVEHDDRPSPSARAGEHVCGRHRAGERGGLRPGGDHDECGRAPRAFARVGVEPSTISTPSRCELAHPPVDQLGERALAREAGDQAHLAAGLSLALEHGHAMAALGRNARGLEAGETRAHDQHVARLGRGGELAERRLVAHRRVLHAGDRELAVAAGDAEVVADAFADALGLAVARATRHERVDEQRARHPDEVAGAVRERLLTDLGPVDAPFGDDRRAPAPRVWRAPRTGRRGRARTPSAARSGTAAS